MGICMSSTATAVAVDIQNDIKEAEGAVKTAVHAAENRINTAAHSVATATTAAVQTFFALPEDAVADAPTDDEMLLAMKSMWYCALSYRTTVSSPDYAAHEAKFLQYLNIHDYKAWFSPLATTFMGTVSHKVVSTKDVIQSEIDSLGGGALVVTGVVDNVCPSLPGRVALIGFRGTYSKADMLADQISFFTGDLCTPSGTKLIKTGAGFLSHFTGLLLLQDEDRGTNFLDTAVAAARALDKPHVLVTGHSLGAGVATLCALYLRAEYPDVEVTLVTFGSPRVFDKDGIADITPHLCRHLRFVNDGDLITIIGNQHGANLEHTGTPLYMSTLTADWKKLPTGYAFPFNPSMEQRLHLEKHFASTSANAHILTTPGGYCDVLAPSPAYQRALAALPEGALKASFAGLDKQTLSPAETE